MTGISPHTAQLAAKKQLLAAARTALADEKVDTYFGLRWPVVEPDWFTVHETVSDVEPKNVGARRQLDETITIHVSVGSWRSGSDEATEIAASDRAFELLAKVQDHIMRQDPHLGGTVLWCLPGASESAGATTDDEAGYGRVTEIAATFVCSHRIRPT